MTLTMEKTKTNLTSTKLFTVRVLMLFPIFTLLAFIPYVNSIIAVVGLALMLISLLFSKLNRTAFVILIMSTVCTLIGFTFTDGTLINKNEVVYFLFMCVYFVFFIANSNDIYTVLSKEVRYVKIICGLWNLLVLFSFLLPSSYGSDGAFTSFTSTTFRLSPSALFVMVLATFLTVTRDRRFVLFSFVPFLSILLGSSRTYLVVGSFAMLINLFFAIKNKKYFIFILVVFIIALVFVVLNSAMGQKFINSFAESKYLDALAVFSSGRSNFWERDLVAFFEQEPINIIFGCGYNFIREVNMTVANSESGIWAHNDFIQVLITFGFVGLLIYIIAMVYIFRKFFSAKMPFGLKFSLFMIWFFNAMFNMYYTYTCSMLCFPMLMLICSKIYKRD